MTSTETYTLTNCHRDNQLDALAHGSRCPVSSCKADADEPCKTALGNFTYPHRARIDRAVAQYQKAQQR